MHFKKNYVPQFEFRKEKQATIGIEILQFSDTENDDKLTTTFEHLPSKAEYNALLSSHLEPQNTRLSLKQGVERLNYIASEASARGRLEGVPCVPDESSNLIKN